MMMFIERTGIVAPLTRAAYRVSRDWARPVTP